MSKERYQYWDSGVFCSFFSEEEGRFSVVEQLLNEGKAGKIVIVTSTIALTEVLKCKGHDPITERAEQKLTDFFEYPFIKLIAAERDICELARRYVWKHNFRPKDALHVATADFALKSLGIKIEQLFSWDGDFVKRNGTTELRIPFQHPYMEQMIFDLPERHEDDDESVEQTELQAEEPSAPIPPVEGDDPKREDLPSVPHNE